jgi:hypothetical protein
MALTFPTGTRYPSNVALLPNRLIRPAFGELYGFDAQQDVGLALPDIAVVQFGDDGATISTTGVSGATSYTYERDTDSGFSSPTTISSGTLDLTVNDTGPLSKTVTYYYRIIATDGVDTTTSVTASIVIPADFTSSSLIQNQNTANAVNTLTLTIRPEADITSGTVTLTGLDVSQTADNASLSITSTSNIFGTTADWTQSTGTLVLTVSTTVPNNADTIVTFDLTNPSNTPNSGSTGITLDSANYNQASITGDFLYTVTPFTVADTTRNESVILADTTQTQYTIEQGADTQDLYVWDGSAWYIFNND